MTEEDNLPDEEIPEKGEDAPDDDENDAINEPAVLVEVSCYLVRMERDGANDDAETAPARAYSYHYNDAPYYLSLSQKAITVIVSIDLTVPALTAAEHAVAASEGYQKLKEAAADYAGNRVVNAIWSADQWRPEDGPIIDNAAEALNATADWLHNLVEKPIDSLFTSAGVSGPLAAAGAGVIANYVLEPITGPVEDTAKIIEVVGIVVGLATGMHPLVLACAKPLARSEIANLVADGLNRAMSSPDVRHETNPSQVTHSQEGSIDPQQTAVQPGMDRTEPVDKGRASSSPAIELGKKIRQAQERKRIRQAQEHRRRQGPTDDSGATEPL
jgi:hypothetical protein